MPSRALDSNDVDRHGRGIIIGAWCTAYGSKLQLTAITQRIAFACMPLELTRYQYDEHELKLLETFMACRHPSHGTI